MAFTISSQSGLTTVRFESEPMFDEVRRAVAAAEEFHAPLELWDLSRSAFRLTSEELLQLAEQAKSKTHHPAKTAILAHDDLPYGLSRMYAAYRQQNTNETRVFREESEARGWLFSEGSA